MKDISLFVKTYIETLNTVLIILEKTLECYKFIFILLCYLCNWSNMHEESLCHEGKFLHEIKEKIIKNKKQENKNLKDIAL